MYIECVVCRLPIQLYHINTKIKPTLASCIIQSEVRSNFSRGLTRQHAVILWDEFKAEWIVLPEATAAFTIPGIWNSLGKTPMNDEHVGS